MFFRRGTFILAAGLLLIASLVFGYDNIIIHPRLTGAAIEAYNNQTGRKMSIDQGNWIVQGSIAEDTDPRYLNHYYDPSTGKGLNAWDNIYGIKKYVTGLSAKAWAKKQNSVSGDYSESAIFNNYKKGNSKRAYQGVGHILHLIQDMGVPAHTRNDSHAMGDPYEEWSKKNGEVKTGQINYIEINNLDQAFDDLANYSHFNFFSKESIYINSLDKYKIIEESYGNERAKYLVTNLDGKSYKLCLVDNSSIKPIFKIDEESNLNQNYWDMLAPKAIGYSAGVIDYFIKEFERIDKEKEQEEKLSFWDKLKNSPENMLASLKYTFGDTLIAGRSMIGAAFTSKVESIKLQEQYARDIAAGSEEIVRTGGQILGAIDMDDLLNPKPVSALSEEIIKQLVPSKLVINPLTVVDINKLETINPEIIFEIEIDKLLPEAEILEIENNKQPDEVLNLVEPINNISSPNTSGFIGGGNSVSNDNTSDENTNTEETSNTATSTPDVIATSTPDIIAPTITIIRSPAVLASSTEASFEFNSNEENTNFFYKLDNGDWRISQATTTISNLVEGSHNLEIRGSDKNGNTSTSTIHTWTIDITAPDIVNIDDLEDEYSLTGFTINWQASSTVDDLAGYDVQYKIAGEDWQNWLNVTTSTSTIFNIDVSKDKNLYFRARSKDNAGNVSIWSEEEITIIKSYTASYVVISEVQIAGGTTKDEFVELYNPTDSAINLNGYRLSKKTAGGTEYNLLTTLANINLQPKSYYLITHPDDYDGPVLADAVYSTTQSIADHNTVILYSDDGQTVVDKVGFGGAGEFEAEVFSNNPDAHQSLERKVVATSTAETMSTGGGHANLGNGYDSNNNSKDFILRITSESQSTSHSQEPNQSLITSPIHLWHFDECRGEEINDYAGNDNLTHGDQWSVGKWDCGLAQYYDYDGASTTLSNFLDEDNFTVSLYYKQPYNNSSFFFKLFNDDGDQIRLKFYSAWTEVWGLPHQMNWRYDDLDIPWGDDWHNLALVVNQTSGFWILYLDGEEFYREIIDYNLPSFNKFEIKGDNNYNYVDEIVIWDRALTTNEVNDIYNFNAPLSPTVQRISQSDPQLMHYWDFNEGIGSTTEDRIGSDDLILNNSLWMMSGQASSSLRQTYGVEYRIDKIFAEPWLAEDLSVEFYWRNYLSPNEGRSRLVLKDVKNRKMFGLIYTPERFYYYFSGATDFYENLIPNDDEWHHLILVYDSYQYKLICYVDGVVKFEIPYSFLDSPITSMELVGENWDSQIDEIKIWDGVISP